MKQPTNLQDNSRSSRFIMWNRPQVVCPFLEPIVAIKKFPSEKFFRTSFSGHLCCLQMRTSKFVDLTMPLLPFPSDRSRTQPGSPPWPFSQAPPPNLQKPLKPSHPKMTSIQKMQASILVDTPFMNSARCSAAGSNCQGPGENIWEAKANSQNLVVPSFSRIQTWMHQCSATQNPSYS